MNMKFLETAIRIRSLVIFRNLQEDPVIGGLCELLETLEDRQLTSVPFLMERYGRVLSAMYPVSSDLGEYVRQAMLSDDNFYIEAIACGETVSEEIQTALAEELRGLEALAKLSCQDVKDRIGQCLIQRFQVLPQSMESLPSWTNSAVDYTHDFNEKLKKLGTAGYGIFAESVFFRISEGKLLPVPHPDAQPLSELFGYETQRNQILKNTDALLSGEGASNMLLYGDAGTGKSSTVKAVAAAYASRGLRLIEIKKDQLTLIPSILDQVSRQALKFILFIDDLSFSGDDDNFSALKAILEGSVAGRGNNTVIYATSNRRHLIRERFSDRDGDDLHVNDTLQETMSLAARFGLTVMFEKPDKDGYLTIVKELAQLNEIRMPEEELLKKAEAHALRRSGRSPRTAKQFVELIKNGLIQ